MLRKVIIAAAAFAMLAFAAAPSHAQPVKIVTSCGTVSPAFATTTTSGVLVMDVNGQLCIAGTFSATGGTISNGTSGQATTSTNQGAVSYLYGFNGTTWDQLQVDASKFLKVNCSVGCSGGTFNNNADNVATSATNGQTAAFGYLWDGATWDRFPGNSATGALVNVGAINSVTPLMGNGATGTGSQRVTLANDNTIPTGWPTSALQTTANTALGAPADSVCGTATGSCSMIALAKFLNVAAGLPLPAQTGIGNVNIGAVQNAGSKANTIAASATNFVLSSTQGGGTGASGDYLSHCIIQPATTSPGSFTILDNATTIYAFPGGASSTSNLTPISVPIGAISGSGGWKITTTTNITGTCFGKFTMLDKFLDLMRSVG